MVTTSWSVRSLLPDDSLQQIAREEVSGAIMRCGPCGRLAQVLAYGADWSDRSIGCGVARFNSDVMNERRSRRIPLDLRGLSGREDIFRLAGAVRRDPAVETWMGDSPAELRCIAQQWFAQMRRCGDDVRELLHDGHPTACVADAAFAYVDAFKDHVNVGFFRGAGLPDAAGLLEGKGKVMRHVKLRPGQTMDDAALNTLIHAAYTDMRRRLETD